MKRGRYYILLFLIFIIGCSAGEEEETRDLNDELSGPPSVVSTSPQGMETNVDVDITISATFDKDIEPQTITTKTFTVKKGIVDVEGKVSYSDRKATFKPLNLLEEKTLYRVILSDEIRDKMGNKMADDYSWSFTTKTDITPPQNASITINNGADKTDSLSVTLTISATDDVAVAGYYVSESSVTPSGNASGWVSISPPTSDYTDNVSFTLSDGDGRKTVYVWFKDRAGNISSRASDSILYGLLPPAPTGVNTTPSDSQITISWVPVSDATSYNIYWSTTQGVTKDNGTKIENIITTSYTHTNLTNGTTYYYVVTAVNNNGESSPSEEVSAQPFLLTTPPSKPTNLKAIPGDKQLMISWDPVIGADSYNIYWDTKTGVTKDNYKGKISNITNPYIHTGLINGTTYYYMVTAVNDNGEGTESDEISGMPMNVNDTDPPIGSISIDIGSIFSDDAEGGIGKWIADPPWGITTTSSHTGNSSFTDSPEGNYSSNTNVSLTMANPFTISSDTDLTFWHKYNTESCCDKGYVEISIDDGSTWTKLAEYGGTLSTWTEVSFDLAPYVGESINIRFRLTSDSSSVRDGWYIDDISISLIDTNPTSTNTTSVLLTL
ncbi:MAG: Ig-like domain-containing protein, partial [Nitrospirota bacterium]